MLRPSKGKSGQQFFLEVDVWNFASRVIMKRPTILGTAVEPNKVTFTSGPKSFPTPFTQLNVVFFAVM